jgi:hypothetical protein
MNIPERCSIVVDFNIYHIGHKPNPTNNFKWGIVN